MKKSERVRSLLPPPETAHCPDVPESPPHFGLYLALFNRQAYYEAHDILEILWLEQRDSALLKGLIQLAGAFVHLQKHSLHPGHPKHSRRLRPARALFELALQNLESPLSPPHLLPPSLGPLPLHAKALCTVWIRKLQDSTNNPWSPLSAPQLDPSLPCLTPTTTMS